MNWFQALWRRLEFLIHRKRMEADLAEEMRLHQELRAADHVEEGVKPDEAAFVARRRFGNTARLREESRDVWGWGWLDSLAQDLRYGLRALIANPGFTATAVLSLALGIGANTAIFTILNAIMLRSLPVENPQQLVRINPAENGSGTNPIWEQVRDNQNAFSGTLAYSESQFDLADAGESHFASGLWVSGGFFSVLGVPSFQGRLFTAEDDQRGGGKYGPVAVISYKFWQSHFGGDAAIVGKTIKLDRHAFEIIGVTPPWFAGLDVDRSFDVAVTIGCQPIFNTDQNVLEHRSWWWLRMLGRLSPGMTIQQAESRMNAIAPEIFQATLPEDRDAQGKQEFLKNKFHLSPATTGFSGTGRTYGRALWTLMAVVALVLLIACANIANLLLARAAVRQREISIRLAIGAARFRVIRQLLTESLLLSLLGAFGGLVFARWGSALCVRWISTVRDPIQVNLSPDLHVLGFTTGVAIVTGILFGLAPAFKATRVEPNDVLKQNGRGSISGASRFRLSKILVAGQVALSLVLLVGAGLFLATMRNLLNVSAGFDPHNVLIASVNTLSQTPVEHRLGLYQRLLERLRAVPGVTAASSAALFPISGFAWNDPLFPEGYQSKQPNDTLTYLNQISSGYFKTMSTPLLMGRDFTGQDSLNSPKVIIISETAAHDFFGSANPIGKAIGMGRADSRENYEVIGVVKDVKYEQIREKTLRTAYLAASQNANPWPRIHIGIRGDGKVERLVPSIRLAIAEIDPGLSLEFHSFETQVKESLTQQRLVAMLSTFFGGLSLLLAAIGLYGVTSYSVAQRQGEIGIRMALGATQRSVMGLVLRDVVRMLAVGAVIGAAVSVAAGRLVTSMLFGITSADPSVLGAAALILAAATAIAGYLPAFRASRLEPSTALRTE